MNLSTFVDIFTMGRLHTFILTFLLFLSTISAAQETVPPKHEYRAVWLTTIENLDWPKSPAHDSAGFARQRAELTALLDSLQAMHVNTILLQTRVRGDVIYPSRIEPFSHLFTGKTGQAPDYDPLAFAIEECHRRGMQLHAWIVTLPVGKDSHIYLQGRHSLPRRRHDLCTHYSGQWYMEPGNPATAGYITGIVEEIVRNYDVDGIHLDYIRYPDRTNGYPDAGLHRKHGRGKSLAGWRRDNITAIARDVYSAVKALKPWIRVSCAPLGKYDNLTRYRSFGWDAYNAVYQEAQEWLKEGIMDILFPMLYFDGNNFYPFVLDWQENSHGRHIVPGIGIYRLLDSYGGWPEIEIERQIETSRQAGTAGTAMFRADQVLGCGQAAYTRHHSTAALVPPMEWAQGEAPDAPRIAMASRDRNGLSITWEPVEAYGNEPPVKYNIYCTLGEDIDTGNVRNLVSSSAGYNSFSWACRTFRAITVAVTAVDAYGRESTPVTITFGNDSSVAAEEIILPPATTWGTRVEVLDVWGRRLYNGRYSSRIGVRGLDGGKYILRMYDRHGALIYTRHFLTTGYPAQQHTTTPAAACPDAKK